jgi:hypothetical protein
MMLSTGLFGRMETSMKKLFVALSTAAVLAGLPSFASAAAPAADPQTTAAVKAMLEAMAMRKVMAASFADMERALPTMLRSQAVSVIQADASMSQQQKGEAVARIDRALPTASKTVARIFKDPTLIEDMVNEMVPLYAKTFTAAEIKELTAFYRTPLGRKMMANMPRLSAESMAISHKVVTPRLNALMQELMQGAQKP